MGMPVKLSDDLVSAARSEAKRADRSITVVAPGERLAVQVLEVGERAALQGDNRVVQPQKVASPQSLTLADHRLDSPKESRFGYVFAGPCMAYTGVTTDVITSEEMR